MSDCCQNKSATLENMARQTDRRRVLIWLLAINAAMFAGELFVGLFADSAALIADAADMFGDATVYALSLYALDRSARWKAGAALLKGLMILGFGALVIVEIVGRVQSGTPPLSGPMLAMSLLALGANLVCLRLLWRFRADDINMASTFECSRNDIIANSGVILAAMAVMIWQSPWPDIVVASIIAVVFLRSAFRIIRDAIHELRVDQPTAQRDREAV